MTRIRFQGSIPHAGYSQPFWDPRADDVSSRTLSWAGGSVGRGGTPDEHLWSRSSRTALGASAKPSGKCSKCGGGVTRMLPSAPDNLGVWSRGGALPDAWVMAYVCRQCGFIEFYAEGSGWVPPSP